MALFVIATPIGNPQDISERALAQLRAAELVIGEELKVLRQTLKSAGVSAPQMEQLNEHSDKADIEFFVSQCKAKNVALVSDCGTPGFCDPGADLVAACIQAQIPVHAVPGASSLMALLSIAGFRVDRFLFYGFLPAKVDARKQALAELKGSKLPLVLMETPYRAQAFLHDIQAHFPNWECVIGGNLTGSTELVLRGKGRDVTKQAPPGDFEPIALLIPPPVNPARAKRP